MFEEAHNAVKILGLFKKFGPTQNILQPVKGQGSNDLNPIPKVWAFTKLKFCSRSYLTLQSVEFSLSLKLGTL